MVVALFIFYSLWNINFLSGYSKEIKFTAGDQFKSLFFDVDIPLEKPFFHSETGQVVILRKTSWGVGVYTSNGRYSNDYINDYHYRNPDAAWLSMFLVIPSTIILVGLLILGVAYLNGEQEAVAKWFNS